MIDQQFLNHLDLIKKFCYKKYTVASSNDPRHTATISTPSRNKSNSMSLRRWRDLKEDSSEALRSLAVPQQGMILSLCAPVKIRDYSSNSKHNKHRNNTKKYEA